MQGRPSPALLADIQILAMLPNLLFTTPGCRWPAAKAPFSFRSSGRPEDSQRLPSSDLCSKLLSVFSAPGSSPGCCSEGKLKASRRSIVPWLGSRGTGTSSGVSLAISISRLEQSPRKQPRPTIRTVTDPDVVVPVAQIVTPGCNHNLSFQERGKQLCLRWPTYLSSVGISTGSKGNWKQQGKNTGWQQRDWCGPLCDHGTRVHHLSLTHKKCNSFPWDYGYVF